MSPLSQRELAKAQKTAEVIVTLSSEMKQNIIDEKIRLLNSSIKKLLLKKNLVIVIFVLKGSS